MSKPEIRIWKEIFKNLAITPEVVLFSNNCEKCCSTCHKLPRSKQENGNWES